MSKRVPGKDPGPRTPPDATLSERSERRPAEQRLAESEARHRALLDAIPDTMLRISREGRILDCRTHRHGGTHFDASHVLDADIHHCPLPTALIDRLRGVIEQALSSETVQTLQYALAAGDASRQFEARVVKSGEDEVVAILRDVTAQRHAEFQNLQAERLVAIGQMMAGLAHESRNAFQRSQACLEMLALEIEDRPEALELVDRIQRVQDHLHYIYEEVRSYAAPIHLRLQQCDLRQIWCDTWSHLELERRERHVRLREPTGELDVVCQADPIALEQIFRNVLENAVHACGDGGVITIRCRLQRIGGNPAVQIAIRDTGSGFTAEALLKVFEPFFTTKTKGTGLGMAIVRRLVEAHGGQIAVGNPAGGGAQVVIGLPRQVLSGGKPTDGK